MKVIRLVNPEDPRDAANVEAGSAAEALHRSRGLVEEGDAPDEPEAAEAEADAPQPKRRGRPKKEK